MANIVGITGVASSININGSYIDTMTYTRDGEYIEFKSGVTTIGRKLVNPFETISIKAWVTGSTITGLSKGDFFIMTNAVISQSTGPNWVCDKCTVDESTGAASYISVEGTRYPSITA